MKLQEELSVLASLEVRRQALAIEMESRVAELKLQIDELTEQIKVKEGELLEYIQVNSDEIFKEKSRITMSGYRLSKTNTSSIPLPTSSEKIDEVVKLINDNRAHNPRFSNCYKMRPVLSREAIAELSDESLEMIGLSKVYKTSYKLTKL